MHLGEKKKKSVKEGQPNGLEWHDATFPASLLRTASTQKTNKDFLSLLLLPMLGESLDPDTSLIWLSLQIVRLLQVGLPLSPRWAMQALDTPLPTCQMFLALVSGWPTHLLFPIPSLGAQDLSQLWEPREVSRHLASVRSKRRACYCHFWSRSQGQSEVHRIQNGWFETLLSIP